MIIGMGSRGWMMWGSAGIGGIVGDSGVVVRFSDSP